MALTTVADWIDEPLNDDMHRYNRQCLVINGDKDWSIAQASTLLNKLCETKQCCYIGDEPSLIAKQSLTSLPHQFYRKLLGVEMDVVVIDLHVSFRPSAIAAVAGTIKAGGTLVLLCPDINQWPVHNSVTTPYFLSYGETLSHSAYITFFSSLLKSSPSFGFIDCKTAYLPARAPSVAVDLTSNFTLTPEQHAIFTQLTDDAVGLPSTVCIQAPRGRGKSTVVGAVAATWLKRGKRIALTAPSAEAVISLQRAKEHYGVSNSLDWLALDNPKLSETAYDLLIIEEAASVPLPLLKRLIATHDFVILSTTTEGYEGSGQGFRTKLIEPEQIPLYSLAEPLRWLPRDPLESFVDAFVFRHREVRKPASVHREKIFHDVTHFSALSYLQLQQIIALLVDAHYQTTPDDIYRLIDSPNNMLHLLTHEQNIVAAAVIEKEGGVPLQIIADDIASGKRRVKGHLTAQSLALLSGDATILKQPFVRINRIATEPALQRTGLGTTLLNAIVHHYRHSPFGLMTASFGADKKLLKFWNKNQFSLIKRGNKPDKASGLISALVVYPLNSDYQHRINTLYQLEHNFSLPVYDDAHINRLRQFAEGTRSIDHLYSSMAWMTSRIANPKFQTVFKAVVNGAPLVDIAREHDFEGKKALVQAMREAVAKHLDKIHI